LLHKLYLWVEVTVLRGKGKLKAVICVFLAFSLLGMLLLGFGTRQVKAQPMLLTTDRDVYLLGENVTVCVLNSGMDAEPVHGYPPWQIFTFPGGKAVFPAIFMYFEWVLMPGENRTIVWDQRNYFSPGGFVEPGEYCVMDNQGWGEFAFFSIVPGLKANFSAVPELANIGESVKFDASNSSLGWNGTHTVPITEYRWNFGDGNETIVSVPTIYHSFQAYGIYYVTLVVYAPGGLPETDSTIYKITVVPFMVGGYSIQAQGYTKTEQVLPYIISVATLAAIFIEFRRKTKRKG
jgi:hypothetical protein